MEGMDSRGGGFQRNSKEDSSSTFSHPFRYGRMIISKNGVIMSHIA